MDRNEYRSRNKSAVLRIVIWAVVLVILVSVFACCLVLQSLGRTLGNINLGGGGYWYQNEESYQVGNAEISDAITDLELDWLAGQVEIKIGEGDTLRLYETAVSPNESEPEDDHKLRWRVVNGCLEVKYCKPYFLWGIGESLPEKLLTLELPASMAEQMLGEVGVESVSADVTLKNLKIRKVDVDTVDGDVYLFDACSVDTLEVDCVSGKVVVIGHVGELDMDGVDAALELQGTLDMANLDGTSGDVTMILASAAKKITMDTVDGDLTVYLPEDVSGFVATAEGVDKEVVVEGFEPTSAVDGGCAYGDRSMVIETDGVNTKLNVKKSTSD